MPHAPFFQAYDTVLAAVYINIYSEVKWQSIYVLSAAMNTIQK